MGQGLLIHEVFRSRTTTHHSRYNSSGRVIGSSQRPLPDNTQYWRQTSMPRVGFEPTISAGERPQTCTLDRAVTGTGRQLQLVPQLKWADYFFLAYPYSMGDFFYFAERGFEISWQCKLKLWISEKWQRAISFLIYKIRHRITSTVSFIQFTLSPLHSF